MSLLGNLRGLLLTRILSQGGTLLLITYLTRQYDPDALGLYFLFTSLLGLTAIAAALGTSGAAEKYISEGDDRDTWYSTGLVLTVVFAFVVAGLIIPVNRVLDILPGEIAILMLAALPVNRLSSFFRHVLRGEQRASLTGYLQAGRVGTFAVLAVLVVSFDYSAKLIIVSSILAQFATLPPSIYFVNRTFSMPSLEVAYELLDYGKFYIIDVIGSKIYYLADVAILGILVGTHAVGRYEVAWRIILAAMMLNGIITRTAFAYISEAASQGDDADVSRYLRTCLIYVFIVPFGLSVGAIFLGSDLINVLFTADYATDIPLLPILGLGFVFQSAYFTFSRALFAMDHPWVAMWPTLIGIVTNLGLNVVLISGFGILGAAIATTGSYAVIAVAYYRLLKQRTTFDTPLKLIAFQATGALVMGASLMILENVHPSGTLWWRLIDLGLGGAIYLAWQMVHPVNRDALLDLFGFRDPSL